jgi:YVTN family beta-propeller protein
MLAGVELRLHAGVADTPTSPPGVQDEPSEAFLAPGRVFAGHEILREAGRGGMGIVYAARHLRLRVVRALKVLTDETAGDPVFRARFERESQLAAALEHPNVVQVYEAGESEGTLYLSMRYVDGPNLAQVLADGPPARDRVVEVVRQVAAGLDAAHGAGLVHRDVKPANILLEDDAEGGRAFLGDFGISRMLAATGRLTETGEMLGTVNYVAPEQIAGTSVDARSDVYSLACVAYEALAGRPPFRRETRLATMFAHANAARPSATALRPELPEAVDAVFARALAVDPDDRYATASEFARDLEAALAGERISAPAIKSWGAVRRWIAAAIAAIALLALTAGALAIAGVFGGGADSPNGGRAPVPAPPTRLVGTVRLADPASTLAVGEFNLWTASASAGSISAVVPVTNDRARPPISVPGSPSSVVAGFGSIWIADRKGGSLLRIEPGRHAAPVRIPVGEHPSDVAASASHMWVTNKGDDTVSRIDPLKDRVDATTPVGNAPASVAVGEGGVWVADSKDGQLTELDPATAKPQGEPVRVGGRPTALAAGEAGVWVIDSAQGGLQRVSPGSRDVRTVRDTTGVTAVATGFGYAWVTTATGLVERVDPTELRIAGEPVEVGGKPGAIAAGDGFVWAADLTKPTLTRIDPRPAG